MNVAVVGASSFIARALREQAPSCHWRYVGWREAVTSADWLQGIDCVLNCAFDNRLKYGTYCPEWDIDLRLAQRLRGFDQLHYLMLSTRMVYGRPPAGGRLHEKLLPQPVNHYGQAKWLSEQALTQLLGSRLSVLRLSNVCGYELQDGRQSFFALASRSLVQNNRVVLDIGAQVQRDFLPVEILAAWLARIAEAPQAGLFNLGAGQGSPCGLVGQWLIDGFGSGELQVSNPRDYDGFVLNIDKAAECYGIEGVTQTQLRDYCIALGQRLRKAKEGRQCAA